MTPAGNKVAPPIGAEVGAPVLAGLRLSVGRKAPRVGVVVERERDQVLQTGLSAFPNRDYFLGVTGHPGDLLDRADLGIASPDRADFLASVQIGSVAEGAHERPIRVWKRAANRGFRHL